MFKIVQVTTLAQLFWIRPTLDLEETQGEDLRPEFPITNQDDTKRFCHVLPVLKTQKIRPAFEKGQAAMTTSVEPTHLDPFKSFNIKVALSFVGPSTAVACKNTRWHALSKRQTVQPNCLAVFAANH